MALLIGPCFSQDASGTLGHAVTFAGPPGHRHARVYRRNPKPTAPANLSCQAIAKFLGHQWPLLSPEERATWAAAAYAPNTSAFHRFMAENYSRLLAHASPIAAANAVAADPPTYFDYYNPTYINTHGTIDILFDGAPSANTWALIVAKGSITDTYATSTIIAIIPKTGAMQQIIRFQIDPTIFENIYLANAARDGSLYSQLVNDAHNPL